MISSEKTTRKSFLASVVSVLLGAGGSDVAVGQEDTSPQRPAVLEEVVVTAQKREERYIDVPLSVATVSGEVLEMAKVNNFEDLIQLTPSITFTPDRGNRGAGVLIRGMGTTAFQIGVEPTVSTVVDGVVLGRTGAFLSALTDIERVEVLRGPQGTLFGKNASAGVVNIITRRPSGVFQSRVGVTATDDDQQRIDVALSGPLSDNIRGRLNVMKNEYDGFIDNRFNGDTLNGEDTIAVRGKLDIDLSARANLLLTADYLDQQRNCCVWTVESTGTDERLAYDFRNISVGTYSTDVLMDLGANTDQEQSGFAAELNVDFDNFLLTSITAWRSWDLFGFQDIDSLPYTQPTNFHRFIFMQNASGDDGQKTDQFTQEVRVATTAWDSVDITAGLFYWEQEIDRHFQRLIHDCTVNDPALPYDAPCPAAGAGTRFGEWDGLMKNDSTAVFGQLDWRFADNWKGSFGLRYTHDDASYDFDRNTLNPGPFIPPSLQTSGGDNGDGVSGKLALQWDVNDQLMTYASYTRGYKAQAFDVVYGSNAARLATPVPEETSDAYELGMKGEFFDNRVRLGVSAFYTSFNDFQGQAFDATALTFLLTSAGTVVTKGLEVDVTARPVPAWLLSGSIAFTDATYDEFAGAGCWQGQTAAQGCVGGTQDLTGEELPNSPDLKLTLQSRYDIDLPGALNLFVSGALRWQDEIYSTADLQPEMKIDSYGIVDLNFGIERDDGRWTASLFAKNLFDENYVAIRNQVPFDNDTTIIHALNRDFQRYVGASITYNFGAL